MSNPGFQTASLNLGCTAINHNGRTVAVVSPQGHVDWILASPSEKGRLLKSVYCEPHLSYTLGLKFVLHFPDLAEEMSSVDADVLDDGRRAMLTGRSCSKDGNWEGLHEAVLGIDPASGRYAWRVTSSLACKVDSPGGIRAIEYNNVYPAGAGRGMLDAPHKRFAFTALIDRDGIAWKFPHQHTMHYSDKTAQLRFLAGTSGGFFLEDLNPVVVLDESDLEPSWGICDMYYDLHCMGAVPGRIAAGRTIRWQYRLHYLDRAEAGALLREEKYVPVVADDYRKHDWPRLMLGRNDFSRATAIDDAEEACNFRPEPPVKQWDRTGGPGGAGALHIVNDRAVETVWQAQPPVEVPAGHEFRLTALVKTQALRGKGMFLRIKPHRFHWRPQRRLEWLEPLASEPVSGTSGDWVRVQTPVLRVDRKTKDLLAWIEVVLDGEGEGWVGDVGVSRQGVEEQVPVGPVVPVHTGGGRRSK